MYNLLDMPGSSGRHKCGPFFSNRQCYISVRDVPSSDKNRDYNPFVRDKFPQQVLRLFLTTLSFYLEDDVII